MSDSALREKAKAEGAITYRPSKKCAKGHDSPWYVIANECVTCVKGRATKRRNTKKDVVYEENKQWRSKNLDKTAVYSSRWRKRNPVNGLVHVRKRQARKKDLACTCCTDDMFEVIYLEAKKQKAEVDHIRPLAVGGRHCTKNLQILTKQQHKEKTAKERRFILDYTKLKHETNWLD